MSISTITHFENAPEIPERFQTAPIVQARETLQEFFKEFGAVTELGCLAVGDALLTLKAALAAREYQAILKEFRVTPVAARDYECISESTLLRHKLRDSEAFADPAALAELTKLPEFTLSSILEREGWRDNAGENAFLQDVFSAMRREIIMNSASQFGWPRIKIAPGEAWTITVIPAEIGTHRSFFVRVGLHDSGTQICPRTTDPTLGGNPAAPCQMCDEDLNHQNLFGQPEDPPVAYWALFCVVHQVANKDGALRVHFQHDPEPFLLLADEELCQTIVAASLAETGGNRGFNAIRLRLDQHWRLNCVPNGGPIEYNLDALEWARKLKEPGELRVAPQTQMPMSW